MAVNYNILNKIIEKHDQQLGEMYYYIYHRCKSGTFGFDEIKPRIIKGKTKEEIYIKIFKNDKNFRHDFLSMNYTFFSSKYKEFRENYLYEDIYEKLQLHIPNIDEMIIEYLDNPKIYSLQIRIGKLNELEKIE